MDTGHSIVLQQSFYSGEDVTAIAHELLGKYLFTYIGNQRAGGRIIETEAYAGIHDRASHAWAGRRTKRTEIMYAEGGVAYVYLCYGVHSLFNIVTNVKDIPDAILIRGIFPTHGVEIMEKRLNRPIKPDQALQGPGLVSKSLGISIHHTGIPLKKSLNESSIWLEDRGIQVHVNEITRTHRIGVEYAGPDAALPYRYLWSKKKADFIIT